MVFNSAGGGNQITWRKQPTCRKSLTNVITQCCIEYTSPWAEFELTILLNLQVLLEQVLLPFRSTWVHPRFLVLVLCAIVCRSFSFAHFVDCPSIYGFWLPFGDLQTLLHQNLSNKDRIFFHTMFWLAAFCLVIFD